MGRSSEDSFPAEGFRDYTGRFGRYGTSYPLFRIGRFPLTVGQVRTTARPVRPVRIDDGR